MSGHTESYMAKPEIVASKPPATEPALARLEKRLKSKLPAPYRQFLLRHNGGQPQPPTFVPAGRDEPTEVINSFLAVDGDPDGCCSARSRRRARPCPGRDGTRRLVEMAGSDVAGSRRTRSAAADSRGHDRAVAGGRPGW